MSAANTPCADGDRRCVCGNLVARVVADRVQIKCRRCRRIFEIPLGRADAPAL